MIKLLFFILLLHSKSNVTYQDTATINKTVEKEKKYKTLNGIASFYSKNLHGTKTSTGETYSNIKYTGASNNFKLGTWVRVTALYNNKSVVVKINDRMHKRMAKKGRIVDLSRAAAIKLGLLKRGLTKVVVEEIDRP